MTATMSERNIADAFDRWLREQRLVFRRDRMDRATTCVRGWPDFEIVERGRVLLIELKTDKGRLSRDQQNLHRRMAERGTTVHVIRDIADACNLVTEWLRAMGGAPAPSGAPTTVFAGKRWDIVNGQLVNGRPL